VSKPVDIANLFSLCERSLAAVGFELCEVEYARDQGGWVLRVYIDHPLDGTPREGTPTLKGAPPPSTITHSDCELASRQLGTVLDVEDLIPNAYRLEVSSPGVRRPLRRERDFARFVGHSVRVQLEAPIDGRKNFVGQLRSVSEGQLGVEVDGRLFQLPLVGVKRARLEVAL
jgi:ribosome maturation factor RimP